MRTKLFSLVTIFSLIGITLAVTTFASVRHQDANQNAPRPEYRILTGKSIAEFVVELNTLGKDGYRLVQYVPTSRKPGQSSDRSVINDCDVTAIVRDTRRFSEVAKYEYNLITESSAKDLEAMLNEMGGLGWGLHSVNWILTSNDVSIGLESSAYFDVVNIITMERPLGGPQHAWGYEVQPNKPDKLKESGTRGFYPVDITVTGNPKVFTLGLPVLNRSVILERSSGESAPSAESDQKLVISTVRLSSLEKDIYKAAEDGFRIERISGSLGGVVLSGNPKVKTAPVHYKISVIKGKDKDYAQALTDEITKQSAAGFQYLGGFYSGHVLIFTDEKQAGTKTETRIVFAKPDDFPKTNDPKAPKNPWIAPLEASLNENGAAGFEVADLFLNRVQPVIVLTRTTR